MTHKEIIQVIDDSDPDMVETYVKSISPRDRVRVIWDFFGQDIPTELRAVMNGGASYSMSDTEPGGVVVIDTGAIVDDVGRFDWNGNLSIDLGKNPVVEHRRKNSSTTHIAIRIAQLFQDTTNWIGFKYGANAVPGNYVARCENGGTGTDVDTGVAADTDWHIFLIKVTSVADVPTEAKFYIDDALVATITTNLPSGLTESRIGHVKTKEDVAKQSYTDYVMWESDR